MRKDEQHSFDIELNALMAKYRVNLFAGLYISRAGDGELSGVTMASCVTTTPALAGLIASTASQLFSIASGDGMELFATAEPAKSL